MEVQVSPDEPETTRCTAWHLCWQAAYERTLFVHPSMYARVRSRLIDAHRNSGRVLIDYLMLPDEIHVISGLTDDDEPGGVARAVGNVVARWVRQATAVRSPVFAGPFRGHRLDTEGELRAEIRMLAWRPVLRGQCRTPSHHPNGAIRTALGLTPAQGFDARPMLGLFGGPVISARSALRSWLARRPEPREAMQWELARGLVLATSGVGPPTQEARELGGAAAATLVAAAGTGGIEGALRLLEAWVTVRVAATGTTAMHARSDAAAIRVRALVGCLAARHGLCSAASVARHFGRARATLCEQMAACRARPWDRQILDTPVQRIVEEALAVWRPGG